MTQSKATTYSNYWDNFHNNRESKLPNLNDLDLLKTIDKDKKILDVGFGKGNNLLTLEENGYHELFGVDISKNAIQFLKRKSNHINIQHSNGMSIPFDDDFFDIILIFGTFSTISSFSIRNKLINDIQRVLKEGGLIYFLDYTFDSYQKLTYDKYYKYYNFYGKFKPDWSDIPFVHYTIEHLRNLYKNFIFLTVKELHISSCRENMDHGTLIIMKLNGK